MKKYIVESATEHGVRVSVEGAPGVVIEWWRLRAAAVQDDMVLATVYSRILTDARAMARDLMSERWDCGYLRSELGDVSERTRESLAHVCRRDGYAACIREMRVERLDPDQVAEERRIRAASRLSGSGLGVPGWPS